MTVVRAIYFYKPQTQGMAAEVRTWHVGVADPHLRDGGRARQDGLEVRAWQEDVAVVRKRSRTLKLKISYNIHKAKI